MGRGGKDKQARREGRALGGRRKPEPVTGVPMGARSIDFGQNMMPSMPKMPQLGELNGDVASILAESQARMRQAMLGAIKRMVESQGGQVIEQHQPGHYTLIIPALEEPEVDDGAGHDVGAAEEWGKP